MFKHIGADNIVVLIPLYAPEPMAFIYIALHRPQAGDIGKGRGLCPRLRINFHNVNRTPQFLGHIARKPAIGRPQFQHPPAGLQALQDN